MKNIKGQISITTAVIGAGGMILASTFTAWATSSQRVNEIKNQVSIVEERENNHFLEVEKRLDGIEDKLDQLLSKELNK